MGPCNFASHIYHRQFINLCIRRRGYMDMVVYIDDFLIVAPTYDLCTM